jgi:uncharacterized protein YjbJ (UPF0337 family)
MNADTLKGKWHKIKGDVKAQWGKLTEDEILHAEGDMEKLQGSLQEKYGYTKEKAKEEVNNFFRKYN